MQMRISRGPYGPRYCLDRRYRWLHQAYGVRGAISVEHRAEDGKALSIWGRPVPHGKYRASKGFALDVDGRCVAVAFQR